MEQPYDLETGDGSVFVSILDALLHLLGKHSDDKSKEHLEKLQEVKDGVSGKNS